MLLQRIRLRNEVKKVNIDDEMRSKINQRIREILGLVEKKVSKTFKCCTCRKKE